MLYPSHIEEKIDFSTIRELLKSRCISSLGKERVDDIRFKSDYEDLQRMLNETDELLRVLGLENELPVNGFYDIREAFKRIRVEGLFLDEAELFDLRRSLDAVRQLVSYIKKLEETEFPHLHELVINLDSFAEIIKMIDRLLDKFGKIRDNASPELARIRKEQIQVQSSVSRTLHAILRQAQIDGYVEKDTAPSIRDGRLVIPVSPSYKRKIGGIVHDESATGKTVYIEPNQVVEANNRVRELENEERREIIRILVEFTDYIRPYTDEIVDSQEFLGCIDFLRAKALFADEIGGIKPQLEDNCLLEWEQAKHPLLFLSLRKHGKEIIPLDIILNQSQRILLISGPNAGGKSVCLKTVVLLQYMLQCGLLIPLKETSRAGIFEKIFIDIGDEQSIENDLSTYSSHLLNIKYFIRNSNAKTLILIDEFGKGTEPQIGGAIAEASLERINKNKSYGVITTHYTNLKHYAEDAEGVINGAMLYDRQHLQPLFQLAIGRPGSSFAVEISRKIGLPDDLIAEAIEKVGADHLNYDKHLQDIVRDKRYWENKRQQIRLKEKRLQDLVEQYELEMAGLNKERKTILSKAKSEAQELLTGANAKIENTIRQIKESEAEKERTQQVRQELKSFRERLLSEDNNDIVRKRAPKTEKKLIKKQDKKQEQLSKQSKEIAVGDIVRLENQTTLGTVLELKGKQAIVAFGQLKSTVKIEKLEKSKKKDIKTSESRPSAVQESTQEDVRKRKLTFKSEIDLRGMRGDEALDAVVYFIDDATMVGVNSVRILHGTGTGALRQIIRQYLNTVPSVRSFRDEHVQFGGAGVTIVDLD